MSWFSLQPEVFTFVVQKYCFSMHTQCLVKTFGFSVPEVQKCSVRLKI